MNGPSGKNNLPGAARAERRALGALMVVAGMTLIVLCEGVGKNLMQTLPPLQVFFGRFSAHLFVLAPFAAFACRGGLFSEFNPRAQILRGGLLAASVFLFMLAVSEIPLARASALVAVSPFVVAALSFALLGERVNAVNLICIAAGFGGVLLIARPDIGLEWHNISCIASGVLYALFMLVSRKFSGGAPGVARSLYVALAATALSLPLLAFVEIKPVSGGALAAFLLIGCMSALAHYLMARAFDFAPAAFLAPFANWEIAAAVVIGFAMHGDIPDIRDWIGIAVIVSCGLVLVLRGKK